VVPVVAGRGRGRETGSVAVAEYYSLQPVAISQLSSTHSDAAPVSGREWRLNQCPSACPLIPPDAYASLSRFPHPDNAYSPSIILATVTRRPTARLRAEIRAGTITTAQAADERAAELSGEAGYDLESDDHDAVTAALCQEAGRAFPGDWEDY
jgi:hypothetical protein